jgi:hypothetical protein
VIHLKLSNEHLAWTPGKTTMTAKAKIFRKGARSTALKPSDSGEQDVSVLDDINEELEGGFGEEEEEDDDELTAATTDNVDCNTDLFLTVKLHLHWIRRQVSHTEAIKTLCQMGRKMALYPEPPIISVKVLAVEHTGVQMAPWQEVIQTIWASAQKQTWSAQEVIDQVEDQNIMINGNKPLEF